MFWDFLMVTAKKKTSVENEYHISVRGPLPLDIVEKVTGAHRKALSDAGISRIHAPENEPETEEQSLITRTGTTPGPGENENGA